uniref:Carboxylesterase type B domain-containing protein n=1 Tax=Meloidogyne incognita TaxID=6306 RepID=A0A914N4T7_MELIC
MGIISKIKQRRVRIPKRKKPWNGILNTTKYSAACLSNTTSTRSPQKYISEDCIYINIFTSPKCLASFYHLM